MSSEDLLFKGRKKIGRGGRSRYFPMPTEIKNETKGVEDFSYRIIQKEKGIVVENYIQLVKFDFDEFKKLADSYQMKPTFSETIGDVTVFQAINDDLKLNCTKNNQKTIPTIHANLSLTLNDLDKKNLEHILESAQQFKEKYNAIVRPEGDLDTIKILKNPEFEANKDRAIDFLKNNGKKIGYSIILRFDNTKNSLEEIGSSIDELSKLKT